MYKKLSLTLLAALLIGLLASCSPAPTAQPAAADATKAPAAAEATKAPAADQKSTLRILIHNNPPFVEAMNTINKKFMEKYPNITVDMTVSQSDAMATAVQTRLTAGDVDLVDQFAFDQAVMDYMKGVEKPAWQKYVEAGLYADLSDQAFVNSWDPAVVKAVGTVNGKVYEINTGRYAFTGVFYNKDLFDKNGVKIPTTWADLVAACDTFKKAGLACMTSGGKDVWPLSVAGSGIILSLYPDQAALAKGLWTGTSKLNDATSMVVWQRLQQMLTFMEDGVSGIDYTSAPGRFATGKIAMYPAGTWDAPAIAKANPDLKFGYFPMPGSDKAEDNKYIAGKYDVGFSVAAKGQNKEAALKWLEFFSTKDIYSLYVNAVGILPTMPGVTLATPFGQEIDPLIPNFRVALERYWVTPKGAGKYAGFNATFFKPYGDFTDAKTVANQAQSDLDAGLSAAK